ncbi:MAG: class II aldolase/adducin family protein [Veillonellales bacterium]
MDDDLQQKLATAVWIARSLFDRGRTTGSTANFSFKHKGKIYITASGTCFGSLTVASFVNAAGEDVQLSGLSPSKELPLHKILFAKSDSIQAVIHTHSFYSTLWSCLTHENTADIVPAYTPYLRMKVGTIGLIPYAKPGSQELFDAFAARVNLSDGYLLQNHGLAVGGNSLMDAFFAAEELEESVKLAWHLRNEAASMIQRH